MTTKRNSNDLQRFFKALTANINWINSLLTILFVGTLILTVFEIHIYRKTLIHWLIPTFSRFCTGLILTPLTSNFLKKYYNISSFFLQLTFNVVTWGGLLIFGFMATNYYFPSNTAQTLTTKIIKTGHLARGTDGWCEEPYCEVIINKTRKQLVFNCNVEIEKYNFINLTIKKGFFGFDIISDIKPTS